MPEMNNLVTGLRIGYDDSGQGPPLLLLHAFPLDRRMWRDLTGSLSGQARVITLDARGFGQSSLPQHAAAGGIPDEPHHRRPRPARSSAPPQEPGTTFSMESFADDAAAVMDGLGIDKATVGGLSMGGYAALAFARKYPQRLDGLILANTRAEADSEEALGQRSALAERIRRENSPRPALDGLPRMLSPGATAEQVATVTSWILEANPAAVVAAIAGLAARPDSTSLLPRIRARTLIIGGEQDAITPPMALETLHHGIPGSRLVLIPGAGHLSNLEAPQAFAAAVADFMERHRG